MAIGSLGYGTISGSLTNLVISFRWENFEPILLYLLLIHRLVASPVASLAIQFLTLVSFDCHKLKIPLNRLIIQFFLLILIQSRIYMKQKTVLMILKTIGVILISRCACSVSLNFKLYRILLLFNLMWIMCTLCCVCVME